MHTDIILPSLGIWRVLFVCQSFQKKDHRQVGLINRNLFSHNSEGCKSPVSVARLVCAEAFPLGWQMAAIFLLLRGLFSVWVHRWCLTFLLDSGSP